jgi:hypothetical protein
MGHRMATTSVYSTRFRIVASLVLAVAVAAFAGAYLSTSADDDDEVGRSGGSSGAGEIVEARIPAPNTQVPQQSTVGIDLAAGWDGTLQLEGAEIPVDELTRIPELARIEFTPAEGKAVEELRAGLNCVTAVVWPIAEGRDASREIAWCFEVV